MSLQMKAARGRTGMAGDPGLWGSLKKAVGTVGGLVKRVAPIASVIPGVGPVIAGAARIAGGVMAGVGTVATARTVARTIGLGGTQQLALPPAQAFPSPDFGIGPVGVHLPGGAPGVGVSFGGTGLGMFPTQANGRPAGMRLNKSSYFLRDGTFVPAGSRWVKARRRNPLNPRALDRAMGRLTSAKRAASKLSRISIRKACN